jgi:TP901 family phage tail tape measure protein
MKLGELVTYFRANTVDFDRAVSHMKMQGQNLKKFGRQMSMYVSLPLAVMGGAAVKTFANFEAGMNKVRAVSGVTGEQFQQLSALARELGATTKFTAKEASEGMGFLAMAGFKVDEIMSALPATLDLAAAGAMELGRSADIVSNIMKGFEKEASQTGEVADILTKTFTSSNTSLEQLGEAMSYAAPIAHGFGQSIETASAAIGIMGDAGIQSSRAGTGLGQILAILAKKSDQIGVSIFDSSGKMRDFADILEDIEKKGMTAKEVVTIFGQRAGPAMQVLLARGAEGLREFREELENSAGTTKKAADTMMEGISGAFIELKSAVSESMIAFVEPFAKSIEGLIDKVKGLVTWFGNLSTETKKTIGVIGMLVTAIGPVSLVLGVLAADIIPRLVMGFRLLWTVMMKNPYLMLGAALIYFVSKLQLVERFTKKAKSSQEEYNAVMQDALDIQQQLKNTEPIERRMEALATLNKRQLEDLKQRIEAQINLEQDYTADLQTELERRIEDDEVLKEWQQRARTTENKEEKGSLNRRIQIRKEAISRQVELEQKGNEKRLAQYKTYLDKVVKQYEIVKDEIEGDLIEIEVEEGTLEKLNKEILKIHELHKILGDDYDINAEKARAFLTTIQALVDEGHTAESEAIQQVVNQLRVLQGEYEKTKGIEGRPTPKIATEVDSSKLDDMTSWLEEKNEGMREFGKISSETMAGIYSVTQSAFNGMQNVISDAFSGTKNVLEGFGEFFKKFIAGLIAKLIAATIAAAVLSFFLKGITGGAGAMSFGTIFKGMIGFGGGKQGLQTGGIVTKPGVFEVGERGRETVYLPTGSAVTPQTSQPKVDVHLHGEWVQKGQDMYYIVKEMDRKHQGVYR